MVMKRVQAVPLGDRSNWAEEKQTSLHALFDYWSVYTSGRQGAWRMDYIYQGGLYCCQITQNSACGDRAAALVE